MPNTGLPLQGGKNKKSGDLLLADRGKLGHFPLPLCYHYSEKTRVEFEEFFECPEAGVCPHFHYHYITTERDQNDPILT
jgi:hypothetical protein